MKKLFSMLAATTAIAFVFAACASSASAEGWGTLKGQILLDGDVPAIPPLDITKDAVCMAQPVPDEKLVVDAKTKGIANIVIYLAKKPDAIHPSLKEIDEKKKEVTFDQKGCRFTPHVMVVRTGQQVRVFSDDDTAHNTHTYMGKNDSDNFLLAPKNRVGVLLKPLKYAEKLPRKVSCDIHSWMTAYWVVVDHPYAAVTDPEGKYEIPELPAGKHEFIVWHESSGYLDKKYTVEIKEGVNEQKPLKFTSAQILVP